MRRWWRTSTGLRRRRCCQRRSERKGGQASGAQGTLGPSGPGNPEGRGWRKGGLWSSQATHPAEGARPRGPGGNLPSTQTRALPRAPFVYAHALPTFAIPGSTVNRYRQAIVRARLARRRGRKVGYVDIARGGERQASGIREDLEVRQQFSLSGELLDTIICGVGDEQLVRRID